SGSVALLSCRRDREGLESLALDELGGQDTPRRISREYPWNQDALMRCVDIGELLLVPRLVHVVDLLEEPLPNLRGNGAAVKRSERHAKQGRDQSDVPEVILECAIDPRVLHLHRDFGAIVKARLVNLADARGRERRRGPLGEEMRRLAPELLG